jgi:carbon monoxide dehydrogenase subunit G
MPLIIGIGVVVLILLGLVAYVATRPTDFRIERSAQVSAPREVVFGIINDFRQWGRWSPFDKRDPNMKKNFEGPASGPGAIYTWNGNSEAGEGRMTIVESKPGELISMKLEFSRPFKASNVVNFKLAPSEGGTRVSWIMDGKHNFVMKAMSLFMDMDKMVGKDFEQGLVNLNSVAQATTINAQEGTTAAASTS